MPELRAHFFYSSHLPIDDPLSPVPTYTSYESWTVNYPPRPFSAGDNSALEEAWLGLASDKDRKHHNKGKSPRPGWKHRVERQNATADQHGVESSKKHSPSENIGPSSPVAAIVIPLYANSSSTGQKSEYPETSIRDDGASSSYTIHSGVEEQPISKGAGRDEALRSYETGYKLGQRAICHRTTQKEAKSEIRPNKVHPAPPDTVSGRSLSGIRSDVVKGSHIPHNDDLDHVAARHEAPANIETPIQEPSCDGGFNAPNLTSKEQMLDDQLLGDAANDSRLRKMFSHKSPEQVTTLNPAVGPVASSLINTDQQAVSTKGQHDSKEIIGSPISSNISIMPSKDREAGITGAPFAKLSSHGDSLLKPTPLPSDSDNLDSSLSKDQSRGHDRDSTETETLPNHSCKADKSTTSKHVEVPVGISRLHLVKLPILLMEPIYWSPVHDICAVTRGTWFYKDTMCPVEPAVANQLEMGYRELRPWSGTWNDELNSAIEVGAAGEEKISHRLWPEEDKDGNPINVFDSILSTNPYCAARCFHGEAAAGGSIDTEEAEKSSKAKTISKKYPNSHVIYKDSRNAFILKPTLQPSEYYGRRPLQKIRKGITVGIHVVRGFDWKSWEKLHPSKKTKATVKAEEHAPVGGNANAKKGDLCVACLSTKERQKVTDLVLVIHGIGQKLSERVESFHFTHAINSFRRSVNVDLESESVKRVLRNDHGGIMVLPVNWRSDLSFEDGSPMKEGEENRGESYFSLKDITPNSIPAVRNLISDVMLDIPFYMSHHKPKMIQAVIIEANRVYRLWCKNNPDFHANGRVHIVAHSLGSAMAVEILSKQPTSTPKTDVNTRKVNAKNFDFKTTNLFLVGSPAGFFLFLEKGHLTPRRGQNKPYAEDADDNDKAIVGEAGTFGCLAVDNIYNVMDLTDPIAYCLNATADPQYAASLKNAQVPSAMTGFFESIGNAVKSIAPGVPKPSEISTGQTRQQKSLPRLPSQLEMEVHDFTREEMAEKKFFLLNDNGQVDWFLNSGGGPLDIQYLNMLGAHSSYWTSQDFIRMLVTEVGRKAGKYYTIPNMRAAKIGHKP